MLNNIVKIQTLHQQQQSFRQLSDRIHHIRYHVAGPQIQPTIRFIQAQ